jgi:hypothetical protein
MYSWGYIYITNSILWLGLKRGDTSVHGYDMLWIYELSIGNRMIGTIPISGEAYLAESRSSLRQHESLRAEAKIMGTKPDRLHFQMK